MSNYRRNIRFYSFDEKFLKHLNTTRSRRETGSSKSTFRDGGWGVGVGESYYQLKGKTFEDVL